MKIYKKFHNKYYKKDHVFVVDPDTDKVVARNKNAIWELGYYDKSWTYKDNYSNSWTDITDLSEFYEVDVSSVKEIHINSSNGSFQLHDFKVDLEIKPKFGPVKLGQVYEFHNPNTKFSDLYIVSLMSCRTNSYGLVSMLNGIPWTDPAHSKDKDDISWDIFGHYCSIPWKCFTLVPNPLHDSDH